MACGGQTSVEDTGAPADAGGERSVGVDAAVEDAVADHAAADDEAAPDVGEDVTEEPPPCTIAPPYPSYWGTANGGGCTYDGCPGPFVCCALMCTPECGGKAVPPPCGNTQCLPADTCPPDWRAPYLAPN